MSRPSNWTEEIDCPEEAREFYRLLNRLQHTEVFTPCHIWLAKAKNGNSPVIKWKHKVQKVVYVLASHLLLDIGTKNTCNNPLCVNPFHQLKSTQKIEPIHIPKYVPTEFIESIGTDDDYIELIVYAIDKNAVKRPYNFENIRPHIAFEDIGDEKLKMCLAKMEKMEK